MKAPAITLRNLIGAILAGIVLLMFSPPLESATISFSFSDPVGDSATSTGDLTALNMTFNNVTGAYTIVVTSAAGTPFFGNFRINVNLFNPDTGTTNPNPSYFNDTLNDFNLVAPATQMILTGTNPRLTSWEIGDRVAANDLPFGNPSGGTTSFRVELTEILSANRDSLGPANPTNFTVMVPEPSCGLLSLVGLGAVIVRRRRRLS